MNIDNSHTQPTAESDANSWLTMATVMAEFSISRDTLRRWTKTGLPTMRKKGIVRIKRDALNKFLGI